MTFFLKPEVFVKSLNEQEKKEYLESKILEFFDDPFIVWEQSQIDADCLVYFSVPKTIQTIKGMMRNTFLKTEWVTEIILFKYCQKNMVDDIKESYTKNVFSRFIKKKIVYSSMDELDNHLIIWKKQNEI